VAASVNTLRACDTLDYWAHVYSPLDMWAVYEVLTDGLVETKRAYRDALARHDHDQAAALLPEIIDLSVLCSEAAEGIAKCRLRYFASDRPWPLARIELL